MHLVAQYIFWGVFVHIAMILLKLVLHPSIQSVSITTKVVSSISTHSELYFGWWVFVGIMVLPPSPIKLISKILLKVALNFHSITQPILLFFQVNNLSLCNSEHFASCADDGSVRVWSLESREQTLQFQVKDQVFIHCTELVYLSDHQGIERNILSKPDFF